MDAKGRTSESVRPVKAKLELLDRQCDRDLAAHGFGRQ
jgi:hypothetical protein